MKKCPECGREYDTSMSICLDDGVELLYGPASTEEPQTAILHETAPPNEAARRALIHATEGTAVRTSGISGVPEAKSFDKRLLLATLALAAIVVVSFSGYRYVTTADARIGSIAVLPFTNATGDNEADFLAEGITETLINSFTKIPELKVTARSTALRIRGREGEPGRSAKSWAWPRC